MKNVRILLGILMMVGLVRIAFSQEAVEMMAPAAEEEMVVANAEAMAPVVNEVEEVILNVAK